MLYKKLFITLLILGTLPACAVQKVQGLATYKKAIAHYEAGQYASAAPLFAKALPLIQGKQEVVDAYFYQAYCSFRLKDYVRSADQFQYFHETYFRDPRSAEALYMQGHALYLVAPDDRLDQSITHEAVQALEAYQDQYPQGAYAEQAAEHLETLTAKLARKALNAARLYYRLDHYRAAVVALNNFQEDFPNAAEREEAAYLKADAQHKYASSAGATQREQLVTALRYCHEFLEHYPDSELKPTVEKICENCLTQIDTL